SRRDVCMPRGRIEVEEDREGAEWTLAEGTNILDGVDFARLRHGCLAIVLLMLLHRRVAQEMRDLTIRDVHPFVLMPTRCLPMVLHPCVAQEMRELTTGDGTRFVLVRTGSLPLVYWTLATPAGVFADPVRAPGLSHAVLRSTLLGSVRMGTRDATAEARSLAE